MKRIAALTMVRNDDFFLRKWLSWYGSQLGKDNLFVCLDGQDQAVPDFAEGFNITVLPRVDGKVRVADKRRVDILSAKAAQLLSQGYDMVIGVDVDEFLVADPALDMSLSEFLSAQDLSGRNSLSGLGCDVTVNTELEKPLSAGLPLLEQRSFARLSTRYTKASVLCAPVQWGSGFHRTRKGDFHIVKGLYLLHFGCADASFLKQKICDGDLQARGWDRHLAKRKRLIGQMPSLPVRDWDSWTERAARLQSIFRPLYTWNKPAMLGLRIIVRIPGRFSSLGI